PLTVASSGCATKLPSSFEELSNMKKFLIPFVLGVVFLAVPGMVRADIILVAFLSGDDQGPLHDSEGQGISVIPLHDGIDTITYQVAFENLEANATASHIHVGAPDVIGPVILPFKGVPSATSGTFNGTLTAADFMPGGGLETFDDAVQAILNGGCYVNIHSSEYPGGEIPAQLAIS